MSTLTEAKEECHSNRGSSSSRCQQLCLLIKKTLIKYSSQKKGFCFSQETWCPPSYEISCASCITLGWHDTKRRKIWYCLLTKPKLLWKYLTFILSHTISFLHKALLLQGLAYFSSLPEKSTREILVEQKTLLLSSKPTLVKIEYICGKYPFKDKNIPVSKINWLLLVVQDSGFLRPYKL